MKVTFLMLMLWMSMFGNITNVATPKGMVLVPAGLLSQEGKEQTVAAFYMDKAPVTVREFRRFVRATNYQTEAEKIGNAGVYNFQKQEWELVKGAMWEYPLGPQLPKAIDNHPVTQVSWNDAQAYCQWANKRLPSVVEWEHAARNGKNIATTYPWGNALLVNKKYKANCWQGTFPTMNLASDGFRFTSPVGHYGKSPIGLVDMAGNVWEWTTDETTIDNAIEKIQKGGSFMCEKSVCHGYAITGKTSATTSSALFHVGFRCVQDVR